ncbi:MAG: Crp/Fnr family transcriptional regulator [Deltaproteobacteria bacterium]|nr:Crp/Fnr family transcriptional regulator [Deltaproteobacteria bacterium]
MGAEDQLFERFGKAFAAGHVLFRDGEHGKEMFVIQAGKVRISKRVRDTEKTLAVLGAGEFFGEMSILNDKPRSADAIVDEEAKLLVIDPKTFEAMIRGNAEIAIRMIKKLAGRLQEADTQIENLLLKDHNSRVVHFLTSMAKNGKPEDGGVRVEITPRDLSQKMGLEIEQVNDVINKLVKAKLCRIVENGFLISDANKMREFLEFLEMKEKFGDIG